MEYYVLWKWKLSSCQLDNIGYSVHSLLLCVLVTGLLHVPATPCGWVWHPHQSWCLQETYVVMEWCDRGSLESAVSEGVFHGGQAGCDQPADMPIVCATLLDISAGMAYLHRLHILHNDLKLRNVLLKSSQVSYTLLGIAVCLCGLHNMLGLFDHVRAWRSFCIMV